MAQVLIVDNKTLQALLSLVRLGIGHRKDGLPGPFDWQAIQALASKQGLAAIIIDGVEKLPEDKRPPKLILLQWIGEVLQNYESRYDAYQKTIAEMAGFYNSHGFKMMVVKGYACNIDWPKPEHRPCGDIDIWQFGQQKEADDLLRKNGIEVDNSHHHHTVFNWRDFMVENHYDFINVHHHKSHVEYEKILKGLAKDDSHFIELNGERVYLPSANLHAAFLFKHLLLHFASGEITLRQVLDWGFFVKAHTSEVDWDWFDSIMEHFGMKRMFNIINAICVENLGFEVNIFPQVQFEPELKEKVFKDILEPEFSGEISKNIFIRIPYKYRRWKANEWKHALCYKESMSSAFWSGVWNHLLKPKSI